MATISTVLRSFKEPTREELTRLFFSLPSEGDGSGATRFTGSGEKRMRSTPEERGEIEINAVPSIGEEGIEDSYVCSAS